MHVAGTEFSSQTIALPIEKQQRVIASGLEMSVVGALLLVAVDRDLSAVDVQHHPLRRIHRFGLRDQLPVDRPQPGQVFWFGEQFRLERLQPRSQGRSTVPGLLRTDQPEGRILGKALGIVHVLISRQPAVDGLAQQVRQRKLRVFPAP